jgi:hypothetical protein
MAPGNRVSMAPRLDNPFLVSWFVLLFLSPLAHIVAIFSGTLVQHTRVVQLRTHPQYVVNLYGFQKVLD